MRNCLTFAVLLRLRLYRSGRVAWVRARKSRHGWFPHFLCASIRPSGTVRLISYVPVHPIAGLSCPPPSFTGRVKWGDL